MEPRYCQLSTCGKLLTQNPKEKFSAFLVRKTCNRAHCNAYRVEFLKEQQKQTDAHRNCKICKAPIIQRDNESRKTFIYRVTCGNIECVKRSQSYTNRMPKELLHICRDNGEWGNGIRFEDDPRDNLKERHFVNLTRPDLY